MKLAGKLNEHPLYASKNLSILVATSQLLNLGCYYDLKLLSLRNFKAGFDKILRGIQGDAREFVYYEKNV